MAHCMHYSSRGNGYSEPSSRRSCSDQTARVAARIRNLIHRFQEPALPGLRVQVLREFFSSNSAAFGSWGPPAHIPVPAGPRRDSPSSLLSGCFRSQESCYSWLLFIEASESGVFEGIGLFCCALSSAFARHIAMAMLLTPVGQQVTPARRPCSPNTPDSGALGWVGYASGYSLVT